jgi:xanthine dehydrogenase YagS FAD-binding subunit
MESFKYLRVVDEANAIARVAPPAARFVAGGTLLVDLMKLGVETPSDLVDVNGLPLDKIETVDGGFQIGAMVRNSDLANDPSVKQAFPALSEALRSGASPQLRNLAPALATNANPARDAPPCTVGRACTPCSA